MTEENSPILFQHAREASDPGPGLRARCAGRCVARGWGVVVAVGGGVGKVGAKSAACACHGGGETNRKVSVQGTTAGKQGNGEGAMCCCCQMLGKAGVCVCKK